MARTILLVAGEASGDLHGAALAGALRRLDPDLRLRGMGGERMLAVGVDLVVPPADRGVVGLTELVGKARLLLGAFRALRQAIRAGPDLVVLIDLPDFNLALARVARRAGVPVLYFVSPQVWAWRRWRVRTIRRLVRKVLVIFPFEEAFYRRAGVEATFVGHPLMDQVAALPSWEAARRALALDGAGPVVGLLPGSREAEVRRHLPLMLEAGAAIRNRVPGARFVLAMADPIPDGLVASCLAGAGVPVRAVRKQTPEVMRAADLLLVASGTATLEAALAGTPMVILYRVSTLSWLVGRLLVRVPHIGMPNLIAGRGIIPEVIQFEATGERLAGEALGLLTRPEALARMRRDLAEVRDRLGPPGAAGRAAAEVLGFLGAREAR